jgi:hypothetical protein
MRLAKEIRSSTQALRTCEREGFAMRKRMRAKEAAAKFARNPWACAQELLGGDSELTRAAPTCSDQELRDFFTEQWSPPSSTFALPPEDAIGFRRSVRLPWSPITPDEIKLVLTHKRSKASPGLDSLTNSMLKRLPYALLQDLAVLLSKLVTVAAMAPRAWRRAIIVLLHKGGSTVLPACFRPIALTSCLGKLAHSILASRVTKHCISQGIIDTSIQKGFMPELSGCAEHSLCMASLLRRLRERRHIMGFLQVDLTNAFGSIPHKVLIEAMQWAWSS